MHAPMSLESIAVDHRRVPVWIEINRATENRRPVVIDWSLDVRANRSAQ
jgi:hypothetical protein